MFVHVGVLVFLVMCCMLDCPYCTVVLEKRVSLAGMCVREIARDTPH